MAGIAIVRRIAKLGAITALLPITAAVIPTPASAATQSFSVTFAARSCSSYQDVFANTARNNIQESLEDLGPDSPYLDRAVFVSPAQEDDLAPQSKCKPLRDWRFTLGTGYTTRAVSGAWGNLSVVNDPYDTAIVTKASTPLLDATGQRFGGDRIAGAVTIKLNDAERNQASSPGSLWAQGGTPSDPVLANIYGTPDSPDYGFAALRCAVDDVNGDNVEYIFFPSGITHVFCYAFYVLPPPTSGTITIKKVVAGASHDDSAPAFPFNGNISYDPNGFTLTDGQSADFYRGASKSSGPWNVTETHVPDYDLRSIECSDTHSGSSWSTDLDTGTTEIRLAAGDHVTCIYTNEYSPPGGLSILKQTYGGIGAFGFQVDPSGAGSSHNLTATTKKQGVPAKASPGIGPLAAGTYKITEALPETADGTWKLKRVSCSVRGALPTAKSHPVEVDVVPSKSTVCTFINVLTRRGAISISKTAIGGVGDVKFRIRSADDPNSTFLQTAEVREQEVPTPARPDTPADATTHLALGAYLISEQSALSDLAGSWSLQSVICDGVPLPFTVGTVEVALTRRHPTADCAFTDLLGPPPPTPDPPPPLTPGPEPTTPTLPPTTPTTPTTPGKPTTTTTPTTPTAPTSPGGGGPLNPHLPNAPPITGLSIKKDAGSSSVVRGQNVTYTITVKNISNYEARQVVVDDLPSKPPVVVSFKNPTGGGCTTRGLIVCRLGTIERGRSVVLTLVLGTYSWSGRVVNKAVVGSSTPELNIHNNAASAIVTVKPSAVSLPTGKG